MPRRPTRRRPSDGSSSDSSSQNDDGHLSTLIDSLETLCDWSPVEQYVRSLSPRALASAVRHRNESDSTPLHVACRFDPPPRLIAAFLERSPEMALWSDSFGWLPLHYACANGASAEVVRLLVEAYPGGNLEVDKRNRTPLHFALCNVDCPATEFLTECLVRPFEGTSAATIADENDMLPIHYACAYGSGEEVLRLIIEGYDEGATKLDFRGRTPLHFVMGNSDRENSVQVTKMLLEDMSLLKHHGEEDWDKNALGIVAPKKQCNMVDVVDHEDNLPLHLLSKKAKDITKREKELRAAPTMTDDGVQDFELHEEARFLVMAKERIRKCLELYLSAEPETTSTFLNAIQFLPDWIRDEAVLHPTIQHMLNDRISHRFPTMILVLDFYLNVAIIICFTTVSLTSAELRADPNNVTVESKAFNSGLITILYLGAVYFALREFSQAISIKFQRGMFAYFRDPENILNLSFIFLTFTFTTIIKNGTGSNNLFHEGAAFTIGSCYLQILAYLRTVFIDFAVFVSGLSYVVLRLGAFLSIMGITIMAFSQMWYTVFKGTPQCLGTENGTDIQEFMDDLFLQYYDDGFFVPEPESISTCEPIIEFPFCESLARSMYKTYSMIFGLGDGLLELNTMSLILSIIWLFLVILMILNLLIGVICDLFGDATKEQAAIIFWTKRLAFVTDMDWVVRGPWRKKVAKLRLCFQRNKKDDEEPELSSMLPSAAKDTEYPSRKTWGRFVRSFDPRKDDSFKMLMLRLAVWVFIVPAWLILGIFTAGWFWPPQLREGLFNQKVYIKEESPDIERFENLVLAGKDLTHAKNEIVQQFIIDRKGIKKVRERTKIARREMKDELRNMKGVMTSLYEVQQAMMS